jgi:hypothetical protein
LLSGFPLTRWWKTNIGLVPYSQMGYKIVDVSLSHGAEHHYEGTGGINQFYFGNAVNLTSNFSAGVNISYLFGSLTQKAGWNFLLRRMFLAPPAPQGQWWAIFISGTECNTPEGLLMITG